MSNKEKNVVEAQIDIEQQNNNKFNLYNILINYLQEVTEAFISIAIVKLFIMSTGKLDLDSLQILDMIKLSLIIGLILYLVEFVSVDFKNNIKSGITYTTGSILLKYI